MKSMIYQFYNEGFATMFCLKPINFIRKKIKNKSLTKILIILVKIFYTILVMFITALVIYVRFFK
jgi:hypothetical protein